MMICSYYTLVYFSPEKLSNFTHSRLSSLLQNKTTFAFLVLQLLYIKPLTCRPCLSVNIHLKYSVNICDGTYSIASFASFKRGWVISLWNDFRKAIHSHLSIHIETSVGSAVKSTTVSSRIVLNSPMTKTFSSANFILSDIAVSLSNAP